MQRLLVTSCLALVAASFLGGCETTQTAGLGEEAGGGRLPTGLRLLEADDGQCAGIVELGSGILAEEDDLRIAPGQNATFQVADEDIAWACLDERFPDSETMECPIETTYVRITHAAGGDEVLFECYG